VSTSISVSTTREYFLIALISSVTVAAILVALDFPLISSCLALLLLAICFFPTFSYFRSGLTGIPAIPVLLGAYGLQFAVPVFLGDRTLFLVGGAIDIPEYLLISALLLAILGAGTLLFVCSSKIVNRAIENLPAISLHLDPNKAVLFCVVFGTVAMGMSVVVPVIFSQETLMQYSALFRILHNQILTVIAILGWLVSLKRTAVMKVLWYGTIVVAVAEGASTTFLEAVFAPIGIMFVCEWIFFKKVRKLLIVMIALGFLFLNPVKGEVRDRYWGAESYGDSSRVEKALYWMGAAAVYWTDIFQGASRGGEAAAQLISRANLIDLLAHIYEQTPDNTPYLNGESYSYFAYAWIPRVIWPEKPETGANRLLAVTYDITTQEGAERSTFGVSLIGEGYANFGALGVILIMVVLGLNLLAMMRLFGTSVSGPGGTAIFLSVFIYFLNGLGSSAEILFGNLFQSMIAGYLLLYWTKRRGAERKFA